MLSYIYEPIYTPPISYRDLYYKAYSPDERSPRDIMQENLKYSLKIAKKLFSREKYEDAIHFYEEALKLGGNRRVITDEICNCRQRLNIIDGVYNKKNLPFKF
jgi:tetratricopeptide (TPR) repeat protein